MNYSKIAYLASIFYKLAGPDAQYMKNRYHCKRNELKKRLGGRCIHCGSDRNLIFDHIDKRKKTIRMSDVHSVADATVEKELKNIQLLCQDCHKKKTHESWDYSTGKSKHGTYWRYRRHGCRCGRCTKAYKEKNREWKAKKK